MSEDRRRQMLLTFAGLLAAVMVVDRVIWPMAADALAEADAEISALTKALARVPTGTDAETDQLVERIQAAQAHFAQPMAKRQEYLESRIGQQFLSSAVPGQPTDLVDWPGKQVVTFKLKLRMMTLGELTQVLHSLDDDPQPMRVEQLRIVPADEAEQMLQVDLTVSTLAEAAGAAGAQPAAPVAADGPTMLAQIITTSPDWLPQKNIFFPELMMTRSMPERSDLVARPFTVVGIDGAGASGRTLLKLADPDETLWLDVGMAVDGVKLVDVQPAAAVFKIGSETASLAVGDTSGRLMLGKRTFRSHCTIAATLTAAEGPLALARFPGRDGYVYLAVGDVLPSGRIVGIGADSITVEYAGYEEIIRVGQDSDSPIPPWTLME